MIEVNLELRDELASILSPTRVLTRPIERIAYASDASFYRLIPQAVVQPNSVDEIGTLFGFSQKRGIPLTFRTAGTSLSGQSITNGILVDISKHWSQIRVEDGGARLRVQPGVIGAHANAILRPYQRRIGPDPASIDACMLGGIIANNSSGMCCGVQENAFNTLHSLTFVLPNGLLIDSSAPDAEKKLKGETPEIWQGLLDLRACLLADVKLRERVRIRYQTKNTNGYSLNAFLYYDNPLDIITHLMIGSEGTLGFIADVVLNTLPEYSFKYTGMLYFPTVQDAANTILPLRDSGARALEIMDRAALRSVEYLPGAPSLLAQLPDGAAALLVEYQDNKMDRFKEYRRESKRVCGELRLLSEPLFTQDVEEQAALWKLRKGMIPSIGANRQQGTSVIIEDVTFPLPRLAEAITDLHVLFQKYGYSEAIILGHAKDGNLHFVIAQSFNTPAEIERYDQFTRDVVELVTGKYDGALKAEHGTGRNMAPFVESEWGATALSMMRDLKSLLDPSGLLNPGVIINLNPRAHVDDLKTLPIVEPEVDRCIECGFCEPNCPSRRLTMTPRQRIVVRREIARQRLTGSDLASPMDSATLASLIADFKYAGMDTCAVDGLCANLCPVNINTGELIKHLRSDNISSRGQKTALTLSKHFKTVEQAVKLGSRLGHLAQSVVGTTGILTATRLVERFTGRNLPKWNLAVLHPTRHIPMTHKEGAEYIYFPSCISRTIGTPSDDTKAPSLIEIFLTLANRAGIKVWIPPDAAGHCCGMPFGSKGYTSANQDMLHRTLVSFWDWSEGGRLPVVMDTSSCAYTLRSCANDLAPLDREKWQKLTILDSLEFAHDILLPRLEVHPLPVEVVLHPNCAARKLNLTGKFVAISKASAESTKVPYSLDCCGFAGDRGLLFPELTTSATSLESAEVNTHTYDGYYSSNLTCEMGMVAATGKSYRSILYLLEQASR
jgi:D-lactate dehydrogenase